MGETVEILSKMGLCLFFSFVIIFLGSVTNGKITGQVTTGYNNTCLWKSAGLNRAGPKNFDCERFVIDSTDQLWNMYRDPATIKSYLHKYMVDDWESITFMGEYIKGMENLTALVLNTLTAFPDIKLHIVDTFCEGNDIDGYKTTMPVIHTATHLGHHPLFGAPTGKALTWYGVPNSFVKNINGNWKYISEINIPDSLSLFSQLGIDPPMHTWQVPTEDCHQLFDWETGYINSKLRPKKWNSENTIEEPQAKSTSTKRSRFSKPQSRKRPKLRSHSFIGWQLFLQQFTRTPLD